MGAAFARYLERNARADVAAQAFLNSTDSSISSSLWATISAMHVSLAMFTDVRDIQRHLREAGLELAAAADESTSGPASLMLFDPDGNPVLIDQHVDSASGSGP